MLDEMNAPDTPEPEIVVKTDQHLNSLQALRRRRLGVRHQHEPRRYLLRPALNREVQGGEKPRSAHHRGDRGVPVVVDRRAAFLQKFPHQIHRVPAYDFMKKGPQSVPGHTRNRYPGIPTIGWHVSLEEKPT